ncbi:MAG: TMEM165/GDT1 family protein [Gammaproteobacteria bacterium]|nr:TMEM165/GDT1 family protein [Gammaproteobacteria bacterium]
MNDLLEPLSTLNGFDVLTVSSSSYLLILAAEFGDKSQLVCMLLAARYKAVSVVLGAVVAFLLLNTLAVVFGVAISSWITDVYISAMVAILFLGFGIHALRVQEKVQGDEGNLHIKSAGRIFMSTFLLITVAEFGDKTQLAVVALASTSIPVAVWLGATLALITTSVLGVWAGVTLLKKMPVILIHRISGALFIVFGILATIKTYIDL